MIKFSLNESIPSPMRYSSEDISSILAFKQLAFLIVAKIINILIDKVRLSLDNRKLTFKSL